MNTLYEAADPVEAEILRAMLASHSIEVSITGSGLWSGRGELPANAYPRLILSDDRDRPRALELLREYERRRHAHGQWRCDCGEESPVTFEVCWSCGAERPDPRR
ncbi:MAG: DUF2007 domain-containing protein [Nevskiales bacterium]|nr:DUF2007 domain-containing protein [Nevskiales bacterium]